jgi:hypothetical protein
MKLIIVLASCLAVALARPGIYSGYPYYYNQPYHYHHYAPVVVAHQHHSQDSLGQYNFGYSGGPSAKSEVKTFDGVVRGSYSYIDSNNELQTVDYSAGPDGFKAAGTNLPVDNGKAPESVTETPEVAAARADHLKAIEEAKKTEAEAPATEAAPAKLEAPKQVEDTVEVKQAREEHLAAVAQEKKIQELVKASTIEITEPVAVKYVHAAPITYTQSVISKPYIYNNAWNPSYLTHASYW